MLETKYLHFQLSLYLIIEFNMGICNSKSCAKQTTTLGLQTNNFDLLSNNIAKQSHIVLCENNNNAAFEQCDNELFRQSGKNFKRAETVSTSACTTLDSEEEKPQEEKEEHFVVANNHALTSKYLLAPSVINLNKIIHLNVGGVKYVTRLGTLLNFDAHGHFLHSMFGGKYSLVPTMNEDEYFIDRNGEYFKYILGFLRNGEQYIEHVLLMLSKEIIEMIKIEAQYFGLYSLMFDKFYFVEWSPSFFDHNKGLSKEFKVWHYDHLFVSDLIPQTWITHGRIIQVLFKQCAKTPFSENESSITYGLIDCVQPQQQTKSDDASKTNHETFVSSLVERTFDVIEEDPCTYIKLTIDFGKKYFHCEESSQTGVTYPNNNMYSWFNGPEPFNLKNQHVSEKLRIGIWTRNSGFNSAIQVSVI